MRFVTPYGRRDRMHDYSKEDEIMRNCPHEDVCQICGDCGCVLGYTEGPITVSASSSNRTAYKTYDHPQ